jgi:hypothetical protein
VPFQKLSSKLLKLEVMKCWSPEALDRCLSGKHSVPAINEGRKRGKWLLKAIDKVEEETKKR